MPEEKSPDDAVAEPNVERRQYPGAVVDIAEDLDHCQGAVGNLGYRPTPCRVCVFLLRKRFL